MTTKKSILLICILCLVLVVGCIEEVELEKETPPEPVEELPEEKVEEPVEIEEPEPKEEVKEPEPEEEGPIPKCSGQKFTVSPVDLNKITDITPLGNLNPPGHTLPTEHLYFHLTSKKETIVSPGDIYITKIVSGDDGTGVDDYTIYFNLCRDVNAYFIHVKELSKELQDLFKSVECEDWSVKQGNMCSKRVLHKLDAGEVIGEVGRTYGTFDFGVYLNEKINHFANPERYTSRTPYIDCPLEYYEEDMKEKLYSKVTRDVEPRCGKIMQDVKNTLQGNWFYGPGDLQWDEHLAFVYDNYDPSKPVISVAGKFTSSGKWKFDEKETGFTNRKFRQVTADDNIYCYQADDQSGRIIVQLVKDNQINIEHQSGSCRGSFRFNSPSVYNR